MQVQPLFKSALQLSFTASKSKLLSLKMEFTKCLSFKKTKTFQSLILDSGQMPKLCGSLFKVTSNIYATLHRKKYLIIMLLFEQLEELGYKKAGNWYLHNNCSIN